MTHIITAASGYILEQLSRYGQGIVHSVYRKTVNLSFDGQLAALQALDSPLSPVSLMTALTAEELSDLPILVHDPVRIFPDTIQINGHCAFSFKSVFPTELKLSSTLSDDQISLLEMHILAALSVRNVGSFELLFSHPEKAEQILFLSAAKKYLSCTSWFLSAADWAEAAANLRRLIGLGIGLTPGGDDFLCGTLAGLFLCGYASHPFFHALHREIAGHLTDTNVISAAFLQCALEGEFSQAVNSLTSLPSCTHILTEFAKIGHSSGTDTLCGIYFLLHNRRFLLP